MYSSNEIKTLHLELTSKCNASCPMCLRNILGGPENPRLPVTDLSLNDIKQAISSSFIRQLKRIYLCGNYGDPIMAPEAIPVLKYFRDENPKLALEIFTNGSARNKSWWQELASLGVEVRFGIDGLGDTNHIYRRNTNFNRIIENAKVFIQNGGIARWDFIVFKHNEHQVEKARSLSQSLGFKNFQIKKTGRFFSNVQSSGKDQQEVYSKNKEFEYFLEKPTQESYQNQSLQKESFLTEKYGSLDNYLDQTPILCRVAKEKSVYLSAEGLLFPCCWTANQLYPWYYKKRGSEVWKLLEKDPLQILKINAVENGIESVIDGDFFQNVIPGTWKCQSASLGKLKVCAKNCGTEFNPFAAQFESLSN